MLDEFCKLFGHLGFSSGALPSSTLLKGIIESLQKGCSPAVSRDRIAVWIQKLLPLSFEFLCLDFCVDSLAAFCYFPMSKTEEQSGMTMEQMEEAGKIEEKKRDAEAAVAQSEAASKKRREGKVGILRFSGGVRGGPASGPGPINVIVVLLVVCWMMSLLSQRVRVPVRFKKPLDSSSPNYRNLTLAMERDGFAEPLVEGSYPSFEVLIYEDDLELLNTFCGVKGLDILDHRMEELPESRSATTIVGDFSLELLLKAIREANPGCFVTGRQVHGKVQDPMMKVFRVLCVVRGPPVWPSVVAGRRPIFAGERSDQFENVPGKTVIVLRPAGCRSVGDVMRWFATSGLTAPDQIKLKDRDLDSGRGGFVLRIPTDEVRARAMARRGQEVGAVVVADTGGL
ncbi:hypothetical protein PAPYR_11822 [Paratrimastix pyriformis]|uniref:Uncharacterized protein n=1 Tax=Paratrimastix pyriformis TaxID=342808 RepID=A0ABQ8U4N6_9EUKA|nr:hypothetical protein PAPYR_11822 [Paratrimastix pyriformis]